MQAEAVGYFIGPLLLVITNHSRFDNSKTALWLAITQLIVWFLFTLCFVDTALMSQQQARDGNQGSTGSRDNQSVGDTTERNRGQGNMAYN